ncbi:MAG TPA: LL-diaminopimelate aminotransferase, partial [Clostridiaceae bacterium]|nr:LL-diaminopimelate aminotransferase [Clostridiaceae bacterium]
LKKSGIMITPGTAFGDLGEGYCRISLTASDERIKSAAQRIIEMDF